MGERVTVDEGMIREVKVDASTGRPARREVGADVIVCYVDIVGIDNLNCIPVNSRVPYSETRNARVISSHDDYRTLRLSVEERRARCSSYKMDCLVYREAFCVGSHRDEYSIPNCRRINRLLNTITRMDIVKLTMDSRGETRR